MAQAWNQVQEASYGKKKEAMDPVDQKELKGKHKDRKDKDIDNDGDVDSSDKYLHKRRKAVSKAIKGKGTETEVQTQEAVELDELSKKTLGNYVKKSAADMSSKDSLDMHKGAMKRYKGIVKATDKLTKEAKDHGNMNNGSPAGEGLSPSAKKELANKTPMNPATDQPTVDKKTFDAIRASGKKAAMRSNDNAAADKTMPKIAEDAIEGKIHDGAMKDIKNHLKKTGEKLKTHKDVERYMDHSGDDHVVHHLDKHNGTDDHFNNVRNRISDHLSKQVKEVKEGATGMNKRHTVEIDHDHDHDPDAKKHNISLELHGSGPSRGAMASGKKKDLQKYLAIHYGGSEHAKDAHPEVH